MKRNIKRVVVLMCCCIIGITALQVYWLLQHYKTIDRRFKEDVNAAFVKAADQEIEQRHQAIIQQFKYWLNDTSIIAITADNHTTDSTTQFHIKDVGSTAKNSSLSFGLVNFTEHLHHITPAAKAIAIDHFADRILKTDLQQGTVYYYTKRLGDSLNRVFLASRVRIDSLKTLYALLLHQQNIDLNFKLDTIALRGAYQPEPVNTDLRRPFQQAFVYASFPSTLSYFIYELRSIIISSILLIIIAILCFVYAYKALISQYRLSVMKDNFVNNMTHELNTPIASIRITAEALQSFDHDKSIQNEYLSIITQQSSKLELLTDKILEMRSEPSFNFQSLNLNDVIQEAIDGLMPQIRSSSALVNFTSTSVNEIRGDRMSLVSMLTNIIDNALKYCQLPTINIELERDDDKSIIRISDNGPGIPVAYHKKIFDKFFRVPQSDRHDVKGHGLGLNYVASVVKAHRGHIHVSDNKPTGTIFTIEL